jgi:hypothetical protein
MKLKMPSATAVVWVLLHTILFLMGIIIFDVPAITNLVGHVFAQAIGGGFAATGAAGIFIYLYIRQSERLSRSLSMFSEGGLTDVFQGRAARIKNEYDNRLQKFKNLDIIGFGLSSFREDYKLEFARWSLQATVRILLIDPEFPNAEGSLATIRDGEEQNHAGKIAADVNQFIAEFKAIPGLSDQFKLRLMKCTPSVNIFRIDDEIFFGPYLMNQASRNSFTFVCREGGFLFDALRQHFDNIWASETLSRAID